MVIASAQTAIYENNTRMPKISLSGKSSRKPASAIGVHKTKKDQVSADAIPPVLRSYSKLR